MQQHNSVGSKTTSRSLFQADCEYTTNVIIANVETLSHDDSYSYSFSSDGHEFDPLAPLWIRRKMCETVTTEMTE